RVFAGLVNEIQAQILKYRRKHAPLFDAQVSLRLRIQHLQHVDRSPGLGQIPLDLVVDGVLYLPHLLQRRKLKEGYELQKQEIVFFGRWFHECSWLEKLYQKCDRKTSLTRKPRLTIFSDFSCRTRRVSCSPGSGR